MHAWKVGCTSFQKKKRKKKKKRWMHATDSAVKLVRCSAPFRRVGDGRPPRRPPRRSNTPRRLVLVQNPSAPSRIPRSSGAATRRCRVVLVPSFSSFYGAACMDHGVRTSTREKKGAGGGLGRARGRAKRKRREDVKRRPGRVALASATPPSLASAWATTAGPGRVPGFALRSPFPGFI